MSSQVHSSLELPRQAVQGVALGIFFMAFFGAYWGFISAAFLDGAVQVVAFVLVGLVTLGFLTVVGIILRYARSLPKAVSPEDRAMGKRIGKTFGMVFGLEIVLIALASVLLSTFQLDRFIAPTIALIVGIHFLPLARLFRVPMYTITGVLLSVLALVALVALLRGLPIAGPSPYNWSLFVGGGVTLILWLTALSVIRFGLRILRDRTDGRATQMGS
jgi:hypothetical protein